jgi:hypothetical protein
MLILLSEDRHINELSIAIPIDCHVEWWGVTATYSPCAGRHKRVHPIASPRHDRSTIQ